MKKYAEVFRLSFKMQIVWRFDLVMTIVSTAARMVAAYVLWSAIFDGAGSVGGAGIADGAGIAGGAGYAGGAGSASGAGIASGARTINGFTFDAMLSYYIVSSIIGAIDFSNHISGEVSYLIRSGRFSGHMVTPMNPLGFFGSMTAGQTAFHFGFSLLSAVFCALVSRVAFSATGDIACLLLAALIVPLGLAFMAAYHYLIGVLTFKFLDIDFFLHVQGSIIAFAQGAMVPLSMLPRNVLAALKFLPFTHVIYTPAMLITGNADAGDGLFGLCVILFWAAAAAAVAQRAYSRLRVVYDGVGI